MTAHEVTPESIPYVVNEDGTVAGTLRRYTIRGGKTIEMFVPEPKGPAGGWKPGQYEKYMADLENRSRPMIRSAIKQQYGTTSFRLESVTPANVPFEDAAAQHMMMLAREEARS